MKKYLLLYFITMIFYFPLFSQIKIGNVDQAINIGINNSEELHEMQNNALLQMKSAKYSIINFLPSIGFSWNEYDKILIHSDDSKSKSIEIELNQMLFDNGKSALSYSINKYMAYLSFLNSKKAVKQKSIEIMETYYNLILQKRLISLKLQLLQNMKNDLLIMEYKYKSGLAVKSDFLQYKISCHELENDLFKLQQSETLILRNFINLLNLPENTQILISDNYFDVDYSDKKLLSQYKEYEKKFIDSDIELKQSYADLEYQKKQYSISKRQYLPSIYLQGNLCFNGTSYPLTQPDYSVKLTFKFENLPYINPEYANGYGIKSKHLNTVSNSTFTQINPDLTYFINKKISKSSLKQSELSLLNKTSELKNSIYQYLTEHDNLIDYISLLTENFQIQKEKLQISEYEHSSGLMNTTDYLKEINTVSESEQKIIQSKIELLILQKKIEMLTN